MAKLYPVTLYYNTGYNTGNIPDSPARLSEYTSKTYPPVYLRQDYGIATIRINATWEEVRDADYASMEAEEGNTYWVIPQAITMLTDHTAEITMVLDPLTSVGGISAINVISGWAERAHVTDDTAFSNILPEPWAPSQSLRIIDYKTIHTGSADGDYNIVVATCDISRGTEYKADVWQASSEAAEGSLDIVVPRLPIPGEGGTQPVEFTTKVSISAYRGAGTPNEKYSYVLPNLYAFDLSNQTVIRGLNAIRGLGVESAVVAMYVIPKEDVEATPITVVYPGGDAQTVGFIAELSGASQLYESGMPYKYYEVKNNKAYCLHNSYVITSITSGDSNTFDASDLYSGGEAPDWVVQTDPSPTGTTYCSPTYYEGQPTHRLEQAVAGLPWLNAGFAYRTGSGGDLGMMNARRRNANIDYNRGVDVDLNTLAQAQNITNGVISAVNHTAGALVNMSPAAALTPQNDAGLVGNITGIFSDIANTTLNEGRLITERDRINTNANVAMGDNLFSASAAANISAPSITFPVCVNAAAYYGNGFAISHVGLRESDIQRFDDFLSAYGYARDTKFVASMLSNRTKHNYVKTSGCHVSVDGAPQWLVSLIDKMFDAGIQIWHVKPSQDALINNPVRS